MFHLASVGMLLRTRTKCFYMVTQSLTKSAYITPTSKLHSVLAFESLSSSCECHNLLFFSPNEMKCYIYHTPLQTNFVECCILVFYTSHYLVERLSRKKLDFIWFGLLTSRSFKCMCVLMIVTCVVCFI